LLLADLLGGGMPILHATPHDTVADHVLGQSDFLSNFSSPPSADTLYGPSGVAIDPRSGRLYVADNGNRRILSWPNALGFTAGAAADMVIGQPDFVTTTPNTGGVSAQSIHTPSSVAVDQNGNLFVADFGNHRVLQRCAERLNPSNAGHGGSSRLMRVQ